MSRWGVTTVATKGLAWNLYHSERIVSWLKDAEDAITRATHEVHVRLLYIHQPNHSNSWQSFHYFWKLDDEIDTSNFEIEIKTARQQDQHSFAKRLHQTSCSAKTMLSALGVEYQEPGKGQCVMSDLAAALTKVLPFTHSMKPELYFGC